MKYAILLDGSGSMYSSSEYWKDFAHVVQHIEKVAENQGLAVAVATFSNGITDVFNNPLCLGQGSNLKAVKTWLDQNDIAVVYLITDACHDYRDLLDLSSNKKRRVNIICIDRYTDAKKIEKLGRSVTGIPFTFSIIEYSEKAAEILNDTLMADLKLKAEEKAKFIEKDAPKPVKKTSEAEVILAQINAATEDFRRKATFADKGRFIIDHRNWLSTKLDELEALPSCDVSNTAILKAQVLQKEFTDFLCVPVTKELKKDQACPMPGSDEIMPEPGLSPKEIMAITKTPRFCPACGIDVEWIAVNTKRVNIYKLECICGTWIIEKR